MNLRLVTRRLARDTRGANLVEYIMLVGLVALLCIAAYESFGGGIKAKIGEQKSTVAGVNAGRGSAE